MSMNVEIFIHVNKINYFKKTSEAVLVPFPKKLLDKNGKKVETFYEKVVDTYTTEITHNGVTIEFHKLRRLLTDKVNYIDIVFSCKPDNCLIFSYHVEDSITSSILIGQISSALYEIFHTELEF